MIGEATKKKTRAHTHNQTKPYTTKHCVFTVCHNGQAAMIVDTLTNKEYIKTVPFHLPPPPTPPPTTTMTNFKRWFWFLSSHARNKRTEAHGKNGFGHKAIEESLLRARFTNVMMAQLCTFLNFECRKLAHTTCQLKEMLATCVLVCVCVATTVVAAVTAAFTDTALQHWVIFVCVCVCWWLQVEWTRIERQQKWNKEKNIASGLVISLDHINCKNKGKIDRRQPSI